MYTYYSSFISGTQNIIKNHLVDVDIIKLFDGGVLYKTDKTPLEIEKIRFFNNSFLVIQIFKNVEGNSTVETMIRNTKLDNIRNIIEFIKLQKNAKTFHIFSSIENQLISVDKKILGTFEGNLEKKLKLKVEFDKKPADFEFWFLYRSEKIGFFMLRITKNKKKLNKGELRPELSNILCLLSEPSENDIFLDPFCGSGAIALERSRIANFKGIFACDNNQEIIKGLKQEIKKINNKKLNKSFFVKNLNFFNNNFDNEYFTKIVSDPPWGFFEKIDNINNFYTKVLNEMYRILAKNGIIILLSANKNEINSILQSMRSKLKLIKNYDILVSGKKAGIYIIKKV